MNNFRIKKHQLKYKKNYTDILDFATPGKLALRNANLVVYKRSLSDIVSDQFLKYKHAKILLVENLFKYPVSDLEFHFRGTICPSQQF